MIQDAITALSKLLQNYKLAYSVEILPNGSIILFVLEEEDSDQTIPEFFNTAEEMVTWMDENLAKAS